MARNVRPHGAARLPARADVRRAQIPVGLKFPSGSTKTKVHLFFSENELPGKTNALCTFKLEKYVRFLAGRLK
ncbi:MAG TPA: hypothetical protein VIL22_05635, partial [Paenibacillaceae bacterium]